MSLQTPTASDRVAHTVAICRRRMQIVATCRYLGLTVPAAIVAAEILAIALRLPAGAIVAPAVAALTIAFAAAVTAAILRAPSARATAAAIDTRLRLQDRVVTALQLADADDPISQLVVRDAAGRVAALSPGKTFPFEAPRYFRIVLGASAAATLLFAVVIGAPGQSWLTSRGAARGASGAAAGGRAVRSATPGSSVQIVDENPQSPSAAPRVSSQPGNRNDPSTGRETRTDPGTRALPAAAERPPSAATAGSPRDSGAAAGAGDRGRGASGFASRAELVAGGVTGAASPDVNRAASASPAPHDAGYASRYQLASARAEAAVAQERVPARLRAYVQRYFVAIHP